MPKYEIGMSSVNYGMFHHYHFTWPPVLNSSTSLEAKEGSTLNLLFGSTCMLRYTQCCPTGLNLLEQPMQHVLPWQCHLIPKIVITILDFNNISCQLSWQTLYLVCKMRNVFVCICECDWWCKNMPQSGERYTILGDVCGSIYVVRHACNW